MTSQICQYDSRLILEKCTVLHFSHIQDFESWLFISPHHFFIRYHVLDNLDEPPDSNRRTDLQDLTELSAEEYKICRTCTKKEIEDTHILFDLIDQTEPLRVLAPHAGVGAFELSMSVFRHMKTTHAIKISLSAAQTLKSVLSCSFLLKHYSNCQVYVIRYSTKITMN